MSKILPDFSQILVVPSGKRAQLTKPGEKTDLFKLFSVALNADKLEVDEHQLEQIICQDLTIDIKTMDKRLVGVLGEALMYYMTVWPGWRRIDEYYKGQLQCKQWFEKFRQYLIFKSNFIIKNAEKFIAESKNETTSKDVAIQVQVSGKDKKNAPYSLCVGGLPYVLNNIRFEESHGDVLIQHQEMKPWRSLKLKEFLNWPYVSVEIKLPDISFTRTNSHRFERYMALSTDPTVFPDVAYITHIKKMADAAEHELKPYSYNFINQYIVTFYNALKIISGINTDRLQELKAIFLEFLCDIKEVDVYNRTMCTHVSIGYNIGKSKYIRRTKKISNDSAEDETPNQNAIDFCEILIPQMEFSLNYFTAVQDFHDASKVSFESINKVLSSEIEIEKLRFFINNTCIVYNCTLCSQNFSGPYAYFNLTKHFFDFHKDEHTVHCFKCHQEFDVKYLADQRWVHACT